MRERYGDRGVDEFASARARGLMRVGIERPLREGLT